MRRSSSNLDRQTFQNGHWRDTGLVLMLQILDAGRPGVLHMATNPELWNMELNAEHGLDEFSLDTDPFTLAQIPLDHRALTPYDGLTEKPSIRFRRLSVSALEIAQTGMRRDWSESIPPVGLYPFCHSWEVIR